MKIAGTGYFVPEKEITNREMENMVETSDEWIRQRVGVQKRRVSTVYTTADMATKAAEAALASAGLLGKEIDLILVATITGDSICPSTAATVQKNIGAACPAFDISSACSGFLFALDTAESFLARGNYQNILVIGAERVSKIVDWSDRATCVIFGDGAGAVIASKGDNYLSSLLYTKGGDEVLKIPSFGGASPFYKGETEAPFIHMDGQETFKFAVSKIVADIKEVAEKAGMAVSDIDHIVPHQANIRIIEYAAKRLGVPMDKFFVNIDKYGNTSAASVPIALGELAESGRLKKGDTIAFSAFGGGLSSAACIIKW